MIQPTDDGGEVEPGSQLDRALGDHERFARSMGLRVGITAGMYQRTLWNIQRMRAIAEAAALRKDSRFAEVDISDEVLAAEARRYLAMSADEFWTEMKRQGAMAGFLLILVPIREPKANDGGTSENE